MATTFYTLEQAANLLGMAPEELNRMAQQHLVRAFADGGNWRFRSQDIEEMRNHPAAGDPGLALGNEPAPAPTSGIAAAPPAPALDDDLIPFDAGPELDLPPADDFNVPTTDEDLVPIDNLFDNPPPAGGTSGINLGADLALAPTGSKKSPSSATKKPESDVRLKMEASNSEFELSVESSPAMEPAPEAAPRATGGPMMLDSDPGLGLDLAADPTPGFEDAPPSVLDSDPTPGFGLALGAEPGIVPDSDPDGGFGLGLAPESPPAPVSDSDGDLGLDLAPESDPAAVGLAPDPMGNDNDVVVDFDSSTLDDSMVSMSGPRPDSDVRLEAAGISNAPLEGDDAVESFPTEEIDLDAELQQAEQASMERRGKTKPVAGPKSGRAAIPPKGTMLPTSSPFELSQDDLEYSTGGSSVEMPLGSEFELTLAPEDGASPLNLGDDEDDIDLGGLPPKDGKTSSSARAELSGINLHNPADSGISLDEGGGASDSVDFELTVDDDGPKTLLKSKKNLPDSDSEFELTLEEDSGGSLQGLDADSSASSSDSDQKDIFETDFNLPSIEGEGSGSQTVALDGSDTDLESSDFDLAVSDTDLEKHAVAGMDESGSEVVVLPDEEEGAAPKKKSKVTGGSLDSVDELLLDDEGLEVEDEEEDELVAGEQTVPAAQTEWGALPVFLLVPCVLIMFVAGLMSYELLHGMWGYHASSKPSGLVVRGIAGLFTEDLPKE